MGIRTGLGDDGSTGLFTGERVRKDDPKIEALGATDELAARIAHALLQSPSVDTTEGLRQLQTCLETLMASIAGADAPITEDSWIDTAIARIEKEIGLKGFVVLGTTELSARIDLARAACRNLERRLVAVGAEGAVLAFANKASDYLFLLARMEEERAGTLRYR